MLSCSQIKETYIQLSPFSHEINLTHKPLCLSYLFFFFLICVCCMAGHIHLCQSTTVISFLHWLKKSLGFKAMQHTLTSALGKASRRKKKGLRQIHQALTLFVQQINKLYFTKQKDRQCKDAWGWIARWYREWEV